MSKYCYVEILFNSYKKKPNELKRIAKLTLLDELEIELYNTLCEREGLINETI